MHKTITIPDLNLQYNGKKYCPRVLRRVLSANTNQINTLLATQPALAGLALYCAQYKNNEDNCRRAFIVPGRLMD